MSEHAETARQILRDNRYVVLATVDEAGAPWATPVWFAHRDLDLLVWVSAPDTRHSRALAGDPRLAVTVFDSSVEPNHGSAFYGRGRGGQCPQDRLEELLGVYDEAARAQGLRPWRTADVTGEAGFRLYVAELTELSLLPAGGPDRRVPITRS